MATIATYTQDKKNDEIEEGWYEAKIFQMISLGSQRFEKNGKAWYSPQILLGFELPQITFESKEGDQYTKVMSMILFLSLNPSGKGRIGLAEILEGLGIDPNDQFDVESLVGRSCEAFISNVESKGKSYTNITNIRSAGDVIGQRQQVVVSVEDFKNTLLIESLPEWIQAKIQNSLEIERTKPVEEEIPVIAPVAEEVNPEDVPF